MQNLKESKCKIDTGSLYLLNCILSANQNSIHEKIKSRLEPGNVCLSLGPESFSFQFITQKYKRSNIQNYNFACCCVCL